jgi:serine/threonine protein kinase
VDVNQWTSELEVKVENPEAETKLEGKDRKPWMVNWDEIKLEEVIGHGSFGEVWVGMFRGKKVAVKLLNKGAISKSHLKEFVHELNIMCSLRHPNTVLFMGACLEEGHMCLIMEYCEKGNLFEILHDVSQPIDYNQIIKVTLSLHFIQPTYC